MVNFFKLTHKNDIKIFLKILLCFVQFIQFFWITHEPMIQNQIKHDILILKSYGQNRSDKAKLIK
jgi:hypothetical protein